jgi:hypothetical protein
MFDKKRISLTTVFLCSLACSVWAQTPKPSFTLTANETGTSRTYVARNYILLKPGFTYTATTGKSFLAQINASLLFPITTIPNPEPGDTSSNSSDNPYVPGNSFNSDPTEEVTGLTSSVPNSQGTAGASDTFSIFPILWLKTVPLTNNLNGGYQWMDVTENHSTVHKYHAQGARYGAEYVITRDKVRAYNFNPAIDLSVDSISKEILIEKSNLAQATIIGVWGAKEAFGTNQFMYAVNGRSDEGVLLGKNLVIEGDPAKSDLTFGSSTSRNFLFQSNGMEGTDVNNFRERSLRVGSFYRANKPNTSIWGEKQEAVISIGGDFNTVNVNNTSDFNPQWHGFQRFKGYTPEMMAFDRQLSPLECRKFETYLAIKYGLTLDAASYVAANGDTIWDPSWNNQSFNNRITGYGREDAFGLSQKVSTTSYEERPYFTDQSLYDAYDSTDSYRLSSRFRLLVMGQQQANPMNDARYVVFGDNSGSIACQDSLITGYTRAMARKWMLYDNSHQDPIPNKVIHWAISDAALLSITNRYSNVYRSDVNKSASQTTVSAITAETLKGTDGYFAWTIDMEYGPVLVKFGTNQSTLTPNSHDYGFKLSAKGDVFRIQRGVADASCLFTVERGQRLEIEKNGRLIYLRVNGIRYKNTEFEIDSADMNKAYYGAVVMEANNFDVKLIDFRHGGFVNTGHKIELSYAPLRASDLANPEIGKIFLIVDRSGGGNFSGTPDSYPCDELDEERSKIIFNNVFWDTNIEGKCVFTFGYRTVATLRSAKADDPDPEEADEPEGKDDVQVYYNSLHDLSSITVRTQTAKPSPVTITIYDLVGRRIDKRALPASTEVCYSEFKLPAAGIYIVRVTTKDKYYSQEVVSK